LEGEIDRALDFKGVWGNLSRDRRPEILIRTGVQGLVESLETKQTGVIDARQVMSGDWEDPDRTVDEQDEYHPVIDRTRSRRSVRERARHTRISRPLVFVRFLYGFPLLLSGDQAGDLNCSIGLPWPGTPLKIQNQIGGAHLEYVTQSCAKSHTKMGTFHLPGAIDSDSNPLDRITFRVFSACQLCLWYK
jgi:hypothetical protein